MPSVSFNFTAAQLQRIQEATALHNSQASETLTPKQFVFRVCVRPTVLRMLRDQEALEAVNTVTTGIETDLGSDVL